MLKESILPILHQDNKNTKETELNNNNSINKNNNFKNRLNIKDKYKIKLNNKRKEDTSLYGHNDLSCLSLKMKKISEIKIYLKQNFHINDINDMFMKNLNNLFATLYLEKLGIIATPFNTKKLLSIKSLDKCDFQLSLETNKGRVTKVLHIYPNYTNKNKLNQTNTNSTTNSNSINVKHNLCNSEFEKLMIKTSLITKQTNEDIVNNIKKADVPNDLLLLYKPEIVNNIIAKEKELINDRKLYVESKGLIEQQVKGFDFSIENIRKKYLKPNKFNILKNEDTMNYKAKFKNFEKVKKNEILKNPKFEFPFLDIDLSKDIIKEINQPIEIPIEVLMKDIVYILDNFPIDHLVNLKEPFNINLKKNKDNEDDYNNYLKDNNFICRIEDNYKSSIQNNQYYKIRTLSKKDVLMVYKKIQTNRVYRIIGLLINLIYWIMFGFINRIQIDKYTKNYMLNKILGELTILSDSFKNKIIYHKLFMPVFILVTRIECEAVFTNKFKKLFSSSFVNKDNINVNKHEFTNINLKLALDRVNELITTIFDPNSYFTTFSYLSGEQSKSVKNKILPNYKKKINATSNLINQLFTTYKNEKNIIKQKKGDDFRCNIKLLESNEFEEEKNYILNTKIEFYKILLKRINYNLKKRNLDPIFNLSSNNNKISNNTTNTNEVYNKKDVVDNFKINKHNPIEEAQLKIINDANIINADLSDSILL